MWLEDEVGSSTWNCNDMLRTWGTVMIIVMIIMGDRDGGGVDYHDGDDDDDDC